METTFDDENQILTVDWKNSKHSFLYCWLVESCQCKRCFNTSTLQRQVEPTRKKLQVSKIDGTDQNTLKIIFSNEDTKLLHEMSFPYDWLLHKAQKFASYNLNFSFSPSRANLLQPILWDGKNTKVSVPVTFQYEEIIANPAVQIEFIKV